MNQEVTEISKELLRSLKKSIKLIDELAMAMDESEFQTQFLLTESYSRLSEIMTDLEQLLVETK